MPLWVHSLMEEAAPIPPTSPHLSDNGLSVTEPEEHVKRNQGGHLKEVTP